MVYISAWWCPLWVILASFESWEWELSNDAKIAENGDHHAEIWTRFDCGTHPLERRRTSGGLLGHTEWEPVLISVLIFEEILDPGKPVLISGPK